jgi:L-threonylcarbamoyladenylate synthase
VSRVIPSSSVDALPLAAGAIGAGDVVAIPTETVYGLAVLPTELGIERLLAAKQRSAEKGIQLLIDDFDQAERITVVTDSARRLAGAFWPGGLTIVLQRKSATDLPELLGANRPTLGLRLPDHEVPRALARMLGPIAASSANISGQPDATTAERVEETLGDVVALIVDDGPVSGGMPSTVVDCSDENAPPRILREGAISSDRIAAALR